MQNLLYDEDIGGIELRTSPVNPSLALLMTWKLHDSAVLSYH